ncbi:MAG: YpmA family protein [Moorellaceae bacterium]
MRLLASKALPSHESLYQIVDFLNKNLKDRRLMFGLAKDKAREVMILSIYEV